MTTKKTCIATTALVLLMWTSSAAQERQEPGTKIAPPFAARQVNAGRGVSRGNLDKVDRNARFLSWYGYQRSRDASTVLYAQSATSGFSNYAISSWGVSGSAASGYWYGPSAADDFIVPGSGRYTITAVYTPGVTISGTEPSHIYLTFYDELKYSGRTRKTTIVVKATCYTNSFSDTNGHGDFLANVSTCDLGRFRGGHDYSVSVRPWFWSNGSWAWQTNRNKVKREAFFVANDGGSGPCHSYLAPVKTCFPRSGYGPDLAFAIYGKQL